MLLLEPSKKQMTQAGKKKKKKKIRWQEYPIRIILQFSIQI